jgi:hypothetical protein
VNAGGFGSVSGICPKRLGTTRDSIGPASTEHVGPAQIAAYATGQANDAISWTVEAHLTSCSPCRAQLTAAVHDHGRSADVDLLARGRERLVATLSVAAPTTLPVVAPGQQSSSSMMAVQFRRVFRRRIHWSWLVRPGSLLATAAAVAMAVALASLARISSGADAAAAGRLVWILAPVLPLGGVALCSVGESDPWREVVLSTPSARLRLVLWRTALVLAVAAPMATVAGLMLSTAGESREWPVLWLLPCLALTTTTLALGTVVTLERAAALVAGLWCAALVVPAITTITMTTEPANSPASIVFASIVRTGTPLLVGMNAQTTWAAVALLALVVLIRRRDTYPQVQPRRRG